MDSLSSPTYSYFSAGIQSVEQSSITGYSHHTNVSGELRSVWDDPYTPLWAEPCGIMSVDGLGNYQGLIAASPVEGSTSGSENGCPQSSSTPDRDQNRSTDEKKRRRLQQNRDAQRAFRERKGQVLTDLQKHVALLQQEASGLRCENQELRNTLSEARKESEILRSLITSGCTSILSASQQGESVAAPPDTSSRSFVVKVNVLESEADPEPALSTPGTSISRPPPQESAISAWETPLHW